MVICQICKKEFKNYRALSRHIDRSHNMKPQKYYDKYIMKSYHEGLCFVCQKPTRFISISDGYKETCSLKCGQEKKKKTCLEKYGVENPSQSEVIKQKKIETTLKHYGVENPFQSEDIKERNKQICIEKYGVEHNSQSEVIKQKKIETCLKNHGTDNPQQNKKIKSQTWETRLNNILLNKFKKFDNIVQPLFSVDDYKGIGGYVKYPWKCIKCNTIFEDQMQEKLPRCPKCYPIIQFSSIPEKEVQLWISKYINIECNKFFHYNTQKYELDIFIPSLNIGIEFNGLYWHSELTGKRQSYHINKTNWFKKHFNIEVIHIFENEWFNKQKIVKSIILNKINSTERRIFARKCQIKEIDYDTYNRFLEENHLIGKDNSKIRLALIYQEEIVSVIGFKIPRFNESDYEYNLSRFCSKLNTSVVGGFSKLLKHFIKNYSSSIITYADRRYSNGELYLNNGFEQLHISKPTYYYFKDSLDLFHRINFQRKYLKDKLEVFEPELTEWENMQLNGWNRIWDCGNIVFSFKK